MQKIQVDDYVVFEIVDTRPLAEQTETSWRERTRNFGIRMHIFRARAYDERFAEGGEHPYGTCSWEKVGGGDDVSDGEAPSGSQAGASSAGEDASDAEADGSGTDADADDIDEGVNASGGDAGAGVDACAEGADVDSSGADADASGAFPDGNSDDAGAGHGNADANRGTVDAQGMDVDISGNVMEACAAVTQNANMDEDEAEHDSRDVANGAGHGGDGEASAAVDGGADRRDLCLAVAAEAIATICA